MKITKEWLKEKQACKEGYAWFCEQKETDLAKVCNKLIDEKHSDWAFWVLTKTMTLKQNVQFAVFCAESVLHFFEDEFPADDRPRKAIEAAKAWLANPNTATAVDAQDAAYGAAAAYATAAGYAATAADATDYTAAAWIAADAVAAAYAAAAAATYTANFTVDAWAAAAATAARYATAAGYAAAAYALTLLEK